MSKTEKKEQKANFSYLQTPQKKNNGDHCSETDV
jgi:hypothetical protein